MSSDSTAVEGRAAELRHQFDASFALPPPAPSPPRVRLLLVRVGPDPYAIRLTDVDGLFADRPITPAPSRLPSLLGLVTFRSTIVPVHDLRLLLGQPAEVPARWLVLIARGLAALAFNGFDGYAHVEDEAIVGDGPPEASSAEAGQKVTVAGVLRTVVPVPALLDAVRSDVHRNTRTRSDAR